MALSGTAARAVTFFSWVGSISQCLPLSTSHPSSHPRVQPPSHSQTVCCRTFVLPFGFSQSPPITTTITHPPRLSSMSTAQGDAFSISPIPSHPDQTTPVALDNFPIPNKCSTPHGSPLFRRSSLPSILRRVQTAAPFISRPISALDLWLCFLTLVGLPRLPWSMSSRQACAHHQQPRSRFRFSRSVD